MKKDHEWNDSHLKREIIFFPSLILVLRCVTTNDITCVKSFTTRKCITVASHDDKCSKRFDSQPHRDDEMNCHTAKSEENEKSKTKSSGGGGGGGNDEQKQRKSC